MKAKSLLDRKVQLAFGSAFAILLIVGATSYRAIVQSSESAGWVRHTHEVLEKLEELLFAMASVESSYRGFVLTGDESYLESYHTDVLKAEQCVTIVRDLTADNAEYRRHLPALEGLVAQKIRFAELAIGLRRTKGFETAANTIRTGRGEQIMNEFEAVTRQLQEEEVRLLGQRNTDAKQLLGQTKAILIFGATLALLVTAAAAWSVHRGDSKRGLAKLALRESEERYRMLLDGIQNYAIFMMDPRGQIVSWNAGAERIKGYTAAQIIGNNFSRFFPPEDIERGRPEEVLRMTAASGRHEEQGMRVRKDGSQFLASLTFTALRDSAGNLRGFSEFSHDLSERMESEAKYRGLLEAAPDAMVVVNPGGEIVLLNVQAEKQFGYRRDELVGQQVKNIIPEGFAERLIADGTRSAADALAQQIGTGIELSGRRKDGSEFPIEIMLSPLQGAEGILVTAAIRDITTRKIAEAHLVQKVEALKDSEARFKDLTALSSDWYWEQDEHFRFTALSEEVATKAGISVPAHFEKTRWEVPGVKLSHSEWAVHIAVLEAHKPFEEFTYEREGPDGNTRCLSISGRPVFDAQGTFKGYRGVGKDVTAVKTAQADLLRKVEELNRSNEELEQFAYIASHDLQEPLRMVASYTQLLSRRYKGKLDSDADEFIAFAVDGASRMQRLIQDLLVYSRVGTTGKDLLDTSSEKALQQTLMNLRGAIEESGALVTHDPLPSVLADEMQLVQLLQNLIGNAIKYQGPGVPRVHVSAVKNGAKKWTFSVQDNGLGIDSQYFERIFGMFQRLHKREEFAGTGIGLSICKKIVERHGGRISVESQPGQGSTFRFALAESGTKA